MNNEMRISLGGLNEWNAICYFEEDEQESINQLLNEARQDINYYNVILDFSDYDKLQNMIDSVPDDDMRRLRLYNIAEQYLLYKIIKEANLDGEFSFEDMAKNLFTGTIETLYKRECPYGFVDIVDELKEKANDNSIKGIARLHFLLDGVTDKYLQRQINELFMWRGKISMVGYTTKNLLSYYTINGQLIECPHDYISLESNKEKEKNKIMNYMI